MTVATTIPAEATSLLTPSTEHSLAILNDGKGFAESLLHDAFNPGVHPQSIDATNYALIALFVCATAAFVAWNYSIHFIVIIVLGAGLLVMMNINRQHILDASAKFLLSEAEKKAREAAKKLARAEGEECGDEDDEDEDYEYIFVSDDEGEDDGEGEKAIPKNDADKKND